MADDREPKTTQTTLESLLELVQEIRLKVNQVDARVIDFETTVKDQLAFLNKAILETRSELHALVTETAEQTKSALRALSNKIDALNRSRLQADADYEDLQKRFAL